MQMLFMVSLLRKSGKRTHFGEDSGKIGEGEGIGYPGETQTISLNGQSSF